MLELFEWWAEAAVGTIPQFVFSLCSALPPSLAPSQLFLRSHPIKPPVCTPQHLSVSFLRIPREKGGLSIFLSYCVVHRSWRKRYYVPELELPRDPREPLVLPTEHQLKNRWPCWYHQNDYFSFLWKFQASTNFSVFSVHAVWFTPD